MFELSKHVIKSGFPKTAAVACQGAEGAFSQRAAEIIFDEPNIAFADSFEGVFKAVSGGRCRYGILPIENSNAGSVTDVYDLIKEYNFYIVRSVKVAIGHSLLAGKGVDIGRVKEVYTHEQAARQCSKFLARHPDIKLIICANTAVAAKLVADSGRGDIAAIASEGCAKLYGIEVLAANIQNSVNNSTRFICISKECEIYDGADKISVMLTLEHKPGALYGVIKRFADLGLNLTKIESRPIADTDFEFMFYFDVQASVADKRVRGVLAELERNCPHFLFLGNYSEVKDNRCS